jgi:flagellar protein FliO/FliZ
MDSGMSPARGRRFLFLFVSIVLIGSAAPLELRAQEKPPTLSIRQNKQPDRPPLRRPQRDNQSGASQHTGGTWWFGSAGIVLVLAVLGGGSLVARRFKLAGAVDSSALKVVGRTYLTPKHAVYLVRVGGRTLLVGTGPQGSPSLLGEVTDDISPRGGVA